MTIPLWTHDEIAAATGGQAFGQWHVTGISIDNRTLKAGELFVALRGDKHDGHAHAAAALKAGAGGLLLSSRPADLPAEAPVVLVADTMAALQALAQAARARSSARIIGVTGSVGKTTAKEMLAHATAAQASIHATQGNLNNHIGLPLTLARFPRDAACGIFELGMSHSGEIAHLAHILRPHVALITTVGPAHIENFADGQDGITKAKAEIFSGMDTKGIAILPADCPHHGLLHSEARRHGLTRILSFGRAAGLDASLTDLHLTAEGCRMTATILGQAVDWSLPVAGEHMALNSLGVLLTLAAAGFDLKQAAQSMASFAPIKGRGVRKTFGSITVIDESYNANPQSMQAALRVLGGMPANRRIAVLGQMNELGPSAPQAHAGLLADITANRVTQVYCCGPHMRHLWKTLPPALQGAWAENAAELAPLVAQAVRAQDVVLVKGSHGQHALINGTPSPTMMQVIAALETRFAPKESASHAA